MGFWEALFGGQDVNLNQDIGASNDIAGFATNMGKQNLNAGSGFMRDILSGDATKQMQVLSPEISAAKTSAANQNKTNAMFGTRSGGTAASTAATNDSLHGYITNLIGSLTGNAANSLLSSGQNLLSQGQSSYGQEAQLSQIRMKNWEDSILGLGVTKAAGFGEGLGLSWLQGKVGGSGGSDENGS